MPYVLVTQRVENYPKWRRAFEENAGEREEAGSTGGHIFRDVEEQDRITLFLAWDDLDAAREYLNSESVKAELEAGEVEEAPRIRYLEQMGRPRS